MLLKERIREVMMARIEALVEELVDEATIEEAILEAMDTVSFDDMVQSKIEDILYNYDFEPIVEEIAENELAEDEVDDYIFTAVSEKIERTVHCPF